MKVKVIVMPRANVRHPESEAIRTALQAMGYPVSGLSKGKYFEFDLPDGLNKEQVEAGLHDFADKTLANPNIETFRVVIG